MNPTAAPAYFPYRHHRRMDEVIRQERQHQLAVQEFGYLKRREVVRKQSARRSTLKLPPNGPCLGCIQLSVCPCPDDCERAQEMPERNRKAWEAVG